MPASFRALTTSALGSELRAFFVSRETACTPGLLMSSWALLTPTAYAFCMKAICSHEG